MKTKIVLFSILASALVQTSAFAIVNCSASCPDGSSCSASGSTGVRCSCTNGNPQASCMSGIAIGTHGVIPSDLDLQNFTLIPQPSIQLFGIQSISSGQ